LGLARGATLPELRFYCLEGLAAAAANSGRPRAAAMMIGMADAARTSFAMQGFERGRRQRVLMRLAECLTPEMITRLRAEAVAMPTEAAVDYALKATL
jgi:hypothetical protein